jgi:murein DD-endopeptidase MepM/ murein hydrolase activator NlpD
MAMAACLRVRALGVVLFVLGFCGGARAEEALELPLPLPLPALISPPSLPSVELFEKPKPPGILKNVFWVMPDINSWQSDRKTRTRVLNLPRSLAKIENSAFEGTGMVLLWPVRGRVSSGFGWRGSGRRRAIHEGIDIPVPVGTPVRAAVSGVVSEARDYNGYGKTVILDHGGGNKTLYAHCSKIAVETGEYVETGQIIAYAGNTGRSTTPHLHFGVIVAGVFRDPLQLLEAEPLKLVRKLN